MKNRRISLLLRTLFAVNIACVVLFSVNYALASGRPVIKVGNTAALSGPAAAWGNMLTRGYDIAVEEINASGGVKINGTRYDFRIITYDDQYNQSAVLANTQKLVLQDKVKFLNVLGGACTYTARPVTKKNDVMLFAYATGEKFLGPDWPLVFRNCAEGGNACRAFFPWLKKNRPEVKKIAMMSPDDETGREAAFVANLTAKAQGFEVVAEEYTARNVTDFYPILTRVLAKKPDLLYTDDTPPGQSVTIFRQAWELGFKGLRAITCVMPASLINDVVGAKGAEGILSGFEWPHGQYPTKIGNDLSAKYKKRYGEDMTAPAAVYYGTLYLLKASLEKAGTCEDTYKIAKVMAEMKPPSQPFGEAFWGGEKLVGIKRMLCTPTPIAVFERGKWKLIASVPAVEIYR